LIQFVWRFSRTFFSVGFVCPFRSFCLFLGPMAFSKLSFTFLVWPG
jgi:hypothetical protein